MELLWRYRGQRCYYTYFIQGTHKVWNETAKWKVLQSKKKSASSSSSSSEEDWNSNQMQQEGDKSKRHKQVVTNVLFLSIWKWAQQEARGHFLSYSISCWVPTKRVNFCGPSGKFWGEFESILIESPELKRIPSVTGVLNSRETLCRLQFEDAMWGADSGMGLRVWRGKGKSEDWTPFMLTQLTHNNRRYPPRKGSNIGQRLKHLFVSSHCQVVN